MKSAGEAWRTERADFFTRYGKECWPSVLPKVDGAVAQVDSDLKVSCPDHAKREHENAADDWEAASTAGEVHDFFIGLAQRA